MQKLNVDNVKRDAVGRWAGIFNSLGIDVGNGKHTKCPVCGGKDRFRFDDKEGKGTYFCNGCGAGDGFSLLQKSLNLEFIDTVKEVARLCGTVPVSAVLNEPSITPDLLRKIFNSSSKMKKGDPVSFYLQSRGIKLIPKTLRYTPKCWDGETKMEHPAMLAVFTSPKGKAITMHRTYLTYSGNKAKMEKCKKVLPSLEKMTGGAIRLFESISGEIGVAEGIETALSCYEYFGVPTWSTVSSTLMESFEPPKGIKKVNIYSDNDLNYAGQKAAYSLANRLVIKNKLSVNVSVPKEPGTDFNDEYLKEYRG